MIPPIHYDPQSDQVLIGKRSFSYLRVLSGLAVVALFALAVAGNWAWHRQRQAQSPWDLVPGNALAVLEINNIGAYKEQLAQTIAGQELLAWPAFRHAYQQLAWLDSLADYTPALAKILYEQPMLASLHKRSKYDVEWLVFAQIGNQKADQAWVSQLLQWRALSSDWNYRTYTYRGRLIEEISRKDGEASFACLHYKDYLLLSQSPLLVEEAVRWFDGLIEQPSLPEPSDELPENAFRVLLNGRMMAESLQPILGQTPFAQTKGYWLATATPTADGLQWSGRTFLPEGKESWQKLANTLPNSAPQEAIHCLEGPLALWAHWRLEESSQASDMLSETPADWSELSDAVGNDVYWALVQIDDKPTYAKAFVLAMPDEKEFADYWEDTFGEKAGYTAQLPEKTWGLFMLGTKEGYAQRRKGYMLVSENTKTFDLIRLSPTCTYPSNFSLQMGATPALAWPLLLNQVSGQWRKKLTEVQAQAMRMRHVRVGLQDYKLDGSLLFHERKTQAMGKLGSWSIGIPAEAQAAPMLAMNHYTGEWEVLLADKWNNIRLIDAKGKSLWSKAVGKLESPIWMVDHYKNKKQQFLFYAGGRLHLLDRNGYEAGGYPHALPFKAKQVSVLPMAEQGYALGMGDGQGNLYIYTYYGKAMYAWNPRPTSQPAALPLLSVLSGEERLVACLSTTGAVQVFEESGKMADGFPVTFQEMGFADLIAQHGTRRENSYLYILADRGTIIQLDAKGALRNKWQLPTSNPNGFAGFIKPHGQTDRWIVAQLHDNRGQFFTIDGQELFSIPLPIAAENCRVQVLKTGEAVWVVAIHHAPSKKAWLYYGNGQPLASAIDADFMPAMRLLPESKKILLVRTVGKQCLLEQIDALGAYATEVVP